MEQSDAGGFTDAAPPRLDESVNPVRRPRKAPAKAAEASTPAPGSGSRKKAQVETEPATKEPAKEKPDVPAKKATPSKSAKRTPVKKAVPANPAKTTATVSTAAPKPTSKDPGRASKAGPKPESLSMTPAEPQPNAPPPEPTRLEALEPKPAEAAPRETVAQPQWNPARPEAGAPVRKAKLDPRVRLMERAVADFAPSAADWLERTRRRYPDAGADALARLAAWDYARMARRRAVASGAANLIGPFAATAPLTRLQVEVVLAVAAAHGRHPERLPRDLVTLLHLRTSKAAITPIAGLAARVLAARVIPFGGAAVAALQARAIEDVAARAHSYYKGQSPAM